MQVSGSYSELIIVERERGDVNCSRISISWRAWVNVTKSIVKLRRVIQLLSRHTSHHLPPALFLISRSLITSPFLLDDPSSVSPRLRVISHRLLLARILHGYRGVCRGLQRIVVNHPRAIRLPLCCQRAVWGFCVPYPYPLSQAICEDSRAICEDRPVARFLC